MALSRNRQRIFDMGIVTARILFLAFLVLTGSIVYNALYLQRGGHGVSGGPVGVQARADQSMTAAVRTDLPPMDAGSGESRLVVRAVQRELAARGYDVGQVDGELSDRTRAAISSFQKKEGLAVTGVPSDGLLRQILLGDSVAPAVTTGSIAATDRLGAEKAPETVMSVQQALADLGYAPGPIDGAWGENTARAVKAFQRDRKLKETGTVTSELLEEFEKVTGRDLTKTAARQ